MDTDALLARIRRVYSDGDPNDDDDARKILTGVVNILRTNPDVFTDPEGALGEYIDALDNMAELPTG
ncbi:hypothetical protein LCGC14_2596220 [marine sediment metagenome]|uniref:Uncharacterized protein n=1 Tax=marine sediment metagenome TaxID=412755 RepID=A0A0F9D2U1_9ZZZZ